jgi:hypothetical protein
MALDSAGPGDLGVPVVLAAAGGYPVDVTYEPPNRRQRFWAIPVLGGLAKFVILIPHFVVVALLAILFSPTLSFSSAPNGDIRNNGVQLTVAGLAFLVLWIPVLLGGRMPLWGYAMVGGFLRWTTRLTAFFLGLTDRYPPFSMHSSEHPVEVTVHIPEGNSRWWAIPVLGFYVKQLILIPHFICLFAIGIAVFVLWLVMWIPVLITGRYPAGPYHLAGGWIRWALRVGAFQGGLSDRYPPFSLN